MQSKFEGLDLQTRGRRFHFDTPTRSIVYQQAWLAGKYILDFLSEFLYFYFPTFCQPCSHAHLAYSSTPYTLSIKLTRATQHIMMKSWPCVRGLFNRRASHFSSVSFDVLSWLSADFALRGASETPTGTLEKHLALRRTLYMPVLTYHVRFHGHHTCC